jgi:hypothetical protein
MAKEFKMNVILDLDNTIINALDDKDRRKLPIEYSKKFAYADYIPFFRIYARPYLQEFLDFLFENFNVAVMTAAEKDYALFIINKFILNKEDRKLEFIFFRYQVDLSVELYGGMKDLRILWDTFKVNNFYPSNTVIIDDLDLVYQANPYNALRIPGFSIVDEDTGKPNFESAKDKELLNMMEQLKYLKNIFDSQINKWVSKAILDYSN